MKSNRGGEMNKFKSIIILIIIATVSVYANSENVLDITDIGVSAEAVAMGGINSNASTAHAIFVNPARLDHQVKWSIDFFNINTVQDVTIQNISISQSYKKYSVGLGYTVGGMKGIERTKPDDVDGNIIEDIAAGPYGYHNSKLYLGSSMMIQDNIIIGGAIKLFKAEIAEISGQGINSDIGLKFMKADYQLGIGIHNIIPKLKMKYSDGSQDEELPLKILINGSKKVNFKKLKSTVHLQFTQYEKYPLFYAGGAMISHQDFPYLEGLLGMRTMLNLDKTVLRKSIGLNFNIKGFKLSYAYEQTGNVYYNQMHYISLSLYKRNKEKYKQSSELVAKKIAAKKVAIQKYQKKIKKVEDYYNKTSALLADTRNKLLIVSRQIEAMSKSEKEQLKKAKKQLKVNLKLEKKKLSQLIKRLKKGNKRVSELEVLLKKNKEKSQKIVSQHQAEKKEQERLLLIKNNKQSEKSSEDIKGIIKVKKSIVLVDKNLIELKEAIQKEKSNRATIKDQLSSAQKDVLALQEKVAMQEKEVIKLEYKVAPKKILRKTVNVLERELRKTGKRLNTRKRQLNNQERALERLERNRGVGIVK